MASFEPVVVVFGSSKTITALTLRLPVSVLFALDVASLEQIVGAAPRIDEACLSRFFVILLESIDEHFMTSLMANHRVKAIFKKYQPHCVSSSPVNQMKDSVRKLTIDLTNDIVKFLTSEGEKQLKLERISLVKVYYQQARILKQWVMSFFKVVSFELNSKYHMSFILG